MDAGRQGRQAAERLQMRLQDEADCCRGAREATAPGRTRRSDVIGSNHASREIRDEARVGKAGAELSRARVDLVRAQAPARRLREAAWLYGVAGGEEDAAVDT